ncbi:MAG: rod shape-determining protein MreD [Lactobacillaceae bacterium]|nr:rod shape-determining protein MreD [Lactobacillaceae bacterium]
MYFKYLRISWMHPILVFLALLLDGAIALHGAQVLFKLPMSASPYLVLLVLLMPILSGAESNMKGSFNLFATAFVMGLIYDLYYTGYVGVSMIGFPLMVWLAQWIQKYFEHSFMWEMAIFFMVLSTYLVYDYLAFGVINVANMNPQNFVIFHMFPSLLINMIIFIISFSFLNWLYQGSREPDLNSYNVDDRQINDRMPLRRRSSR